MRSSRVRLGVTALVLGLGFFAGLHSFASVHAASFTVTTTADSGPGSLRQVLTDANLAPGPDTITFAVSGTIVLDSPLPAVADDLTLQGPGAGQLAISGSYLYRIFDICASVAVTITDLALTEGRAPNGEAGGAIRSRGQLQLLRVHLRDNLSVSTGGALSSELGTLHIESSVVQSNTASGNGGIAISKSRGTITGTIISDNQGSGVAAERSPAVHITATQIISNTGLGLDADWSDLYLSTVQVFANAEGGIATFGGLLAASDSEIIKNSSDQGAGINSIWSTVLLTDTVLMQNKASRDGGAIYLLLSDAHFTMIGGTISANTADRGAGIYVASGTLQVQGARILDNQGSRGPALYLNSMRDAEVADSCIVNNHATSGDGRAVELATYNYYYVSAPKNWWGAADGPSGAALGSGDSIGDCVIVPNFETAAPDGCPSLPAVYLYLPALEK